MTTAMPPRAVPAPAVPRIPGAALGRLMLTDVAVVVPARDEEQNLPLSLSALRRAVATCTVSHPNVRVRCLVVLDSCRDASAHVVRSMGFEALEIEGGGVGHARAAGASRAMVEHHLAGKDQRTLWLASTDADSRVPAHWLDVHIERAHAGVDVLLGTVEPDATLTGSVRSAWSAAHVLRRGHRHVHGANLGVRACAYLAAGGFGSFAAHEDVELVRRLRSQPHVTIEALDTHRVVTSGRLTGRAPHGFATFLRALADERP